MSSIKLRPRTDYICAESSGGRMVEPSQQNQNRSDRLCPARCTQRALQALQSMMSFRKWSLSTHCSVEHGYHKSLVASNTMFQRSSKAVQYLLPAAITVFTVVNPTYFDQWLHHGICEFPIPCRPLGDLGPYPLVRRIRRRKDEASEELRAVDGNLCSPRSVHRS